MTKEEKLLLKIYNKTEDENIKKTLAVLLDDEEETVEETKEEPEVVKEEVKEEPKKEEPKVETKEVDFEEMFNKLQKEFSVVVKEVQSLKEQKKETFGVKAKPKEAKDASEFDDIFAKLTSNQN